MTKQKYKKLNLLLDSDFSFTQQEIKDELGIHVLPNQLSTFKCFMLNFAEYREPLAFSAGNNPYPPHDFNIHDLTYSKVQGVYKKLDEARLAKFFKGKPQGRAKKAELSRLRPSKKLMNWVDKKFPYADSIYLNPQTHVQLRNDKKVNVSYKHTFYTKHVDLVMSNYHQKLIEWDYSLDGIAMDKVHMYCNFGFFDRDSTGNPNIRYGGRWWSEHNQLSSKDRVNRISFDNVKGGDDLVELDFKSSILTALRYWELGREPEKDHYEMFRHDDYVDRKHIKNLVQLMLNRMRRGLEEAYIDNFYIAKEGKSKKKLTIKQKIEKLTIEQKVELHWINDTAGRFIGRMQYDIRHWFFGGKRRGQLASFIESNLMLEIVRRCCNENIAVLTAFDSFIVPKKHQKRVYQLMYEEDVFPFVKELINKDEQDSVKRMFMGRLDWNKASTKALAKKAKAKGLTLLDYTVIKATHLYKYDSCRHTTTYNVKSINDKFQPRCDECFDKKLHDEADRAGLILLGKGKHDKYRLYQFIKCGHKREILYKQVKINSFECKVCWFEELQADGKANGLSVIKRGKRSAPRKNRKGNRGRPYWFVCIFDDCGHEQEMLPNHIRGGPDKCKTCILEKHHEEAKEVGLKLLGESTDGHSDRRSYQFLSCKHKQDILVVHVRNGYFQCQICEETALDLPSKVYLLKLGHKRLQWFKLGHAQYIKRRIKDYGLIEGVEVEVLKTINFDTGREALEFENKIHKSITSNKHLERTHFSGEQMKEFMTKSGFTECYNILLEPYLLKCLKTREVFEMPQD